jgi:hypothetical protein
MSFTSYMIPSPDNFSSINNDRITKVFPINDYSYFESNPYFRPYQILQKDWGQNEKYLYHVVNMLRLIKNTSIMSK